MRHTIEVKRLPRGEYTLEGAFYAQVDGHNVGDPERAFWRTREQAQACGERFVAIVYGEDA